MSAVLPAGIAAQQALTQQAVALETIKKSAEADQQLANTLLETVTASNKGGSVDLYA
jgi:hypothetical protein